MFPEFFKNKMKEVGSFFNIMKGKMSGDDEKRVHGAKKALDAVNEERKVYEKEIEDAYQGIDPDTKRYQEETIQEKVVRESGGRDISAI